MKTDQEIQEIALKYVPVLKTSPELNMDKFNIAFLKTFVDCINEAQDPYEAIKKIEIERVEVNVRKVWNELN